MAWAAVRIAGVGSASVCVLWGNFSRSTATATQGKPDSRKAGIVLPTTVNHGQSS